MAASNVAKSLIKLGDLMQKAKTNKIRERKVTVDEGTLQMKLDAIKVKTEALLADVDRTPEGAPVAITREELMAKVRGIYGLT